MLSNLFMYWRAEATYNAQPPSPVSALTAKLVRSTGGADTSLTVRVSWMAAPSTDVNVPADDPRDPLFYEVKFKNRGGGEEETLTTNNTHANVPGLLQGIEYEFTVSARNSQGKSEPQLTFLRTPDGVPDASPMHIMQDMIDANTIKLAWDPPPKLNRNGRIVGYVAVLEDLDGGRNATKEPSSTQPYALFTVRPDRRYTFRVRARTSLGDGPWSSKVAVVPNDQPALIPAPSGVRVQALADDTAVVSWQAVAQADGYVVRYTYNNTRSADYNNWRRKNTQHSTNHYVFNKELKPNTPYAFCVASIQNSRVGECSKVHVIDQLSVKYLVQNLRVEWVAVDQAKLAWDYHGQSNEMFYVNYTAVKSYINSHNEQKSINFSNYVDVTNDKHIIVHKLRAFTDYTFQVGVEYNGQRYWPKTIRTKTRVKEPPYVQSPSFKRVIDKNSVMLAVQAAAEENGPISHYWLVVVNAEFDKPQVLSNEQLVKGIKDEYYVAANLSHKGLLNTMDGDPFDVVVGGNKALNGFQSHPLLPDTDYRAFLRAFADAREEEVKEVNGRPPPESILSSNRRLYTNSDLTPTFRTSSTYMKPSKEGGAGAISGTTFAWVGGPLIAFAIIAIIVFCLVLFYLKKNSSKKGAPGGMVRHGSISKVQLGPTPNETQKLLPDTGVMNMMAPNVPLTIAANNGYNVEPMELGAMNAQMTPNMHLGNAMATPNNQIFPMSNTATTHPPVPITELAQHIERLKANDNMIFFQEYESIETGQSFTWEHSSLEVNKPKNRYANVVAYDHSRVTLQNPMNDYINANYVDGHGPEKRRAYIATQGPLPETFVDFWEMVWEQTAVTIVMLTRLEERTRVKCDQYWPSRGALQYGQITVTLMDTLHLAHYTIRTFSIEKAGESEVRDIRHLQFTAWPDHGVPDHPTPFLMFLKRVKSLNPPEAGPVVCHCSAGIGRTGAFIAIDCMLERLRFENTVDVYGCITQLRTQRSYMVQTEEQYVFVHDAVLDAVQSGSTEVPAAKLMTHIQALMQTQQYDQNATGMQLEFRHLAALRMPNARYSVANSPCNKSRNRLVNILPYDNTRCILSMLGGVEGSDYINSSWIDGYRAPFAYLASQGPLPNTVGDHWRMVWEHNATILVMLCQLNEVGRETCAEYWPNERPERYGPYVVEPIAEYNMPQYVLREFKMTDSQSGESRTIRHFQFTEWPEQGAPKLGELFIEFVGQVHKTKEQFGADGPIVVHCSTGVGRTGVFITLSIVLERMRYENVVDIFTTVKLLRTQRANMVQTEEQYHFCYQAAMEYLGSFDHFALQ